MIATGNVEGRQQSIFRLKTTKFRVYTQNNLPIRLADLNGAAIYFCGRHNAPSWQPNRWWKANFLGIPALWWRGIRKRDKFPLFIGTFINDQYQGPYGKPHMWTEHAITQNYFNNNGGFKYFQYPTIYVVPNHLQNYLRVSIVKMFCDIKQYEVQSLNFIS